MSPGSKRRALVPPELGYVGGGEGPQPPTFATKRQLETHRRCVRVGLRGFGTVGREGLWVGCGRSGVGGKEHIVVAGNMFPSAGPRRFQAIESFPCNPHFQVPMLCPAPPLPVMTDE